MNASLVPSGDHAGRIAASARGVTLTAPEPSGFTTQTSKTPFPRSRENASLPFAPGNEAPVGAAPIASTSATTASWTSSEQVLLARTAPPSGGRTAHVTPATKVGQSVWSQARTPRASASSAAGQAGGGGRFAARLRFAWIV